MTGEPTVSAVLPVYNCPQYVGQAIESILSQTFSDFELIIIDDGSTDQTPDVLRRYDDRRIRLISQNNHGLSATLNRGIELATGRYIARQDQDDFSYPNRFAKQVAYLDEHPSCAIVGTWAEIVRQDGGSRGHHKHPSDNSSLQYELLLNNPFVHSSVMLRRSALDHVGLYSVDKRRQPPEDYELWSRLARHYGVANIPEVLHVYREVPGSMSRDGIAPFLERVIRISSENVAAATGLPYDDERVVNIVALAHGALHALRGKPDFDELKEIFARAAEAVAPVRKEQLRAKAKKRIDALRFNYPELSGARPIARKFAGLARRAASLFKNR